MEAKKRFKEGMREKERVVSEKLMRKSILRGILCAKKSETKKRRKVEKKGNGFDDSISIWVS